MIPTPYTLAVRSRQATQMQSFDNRSSGGGRLYPTEIRDLQKLCRLHAGIGSGRKAFTVAPR